MTTPGEDPPGLGNTTYPSGQPLGTSSAQQRNMSQPPTSTPGIAAGPSTPSSGGNNHALHNPMTGEGKQETLRIYVWHLPRFASGRTWRSITAV